MPNPPENDPSRAFDDMRGELSLLYRAIEGLAAERQAAPDYEPALTKIDTDLAKLIKWAGWVQECPTLQMTPMPWHAR